MFSTTSFFCVEKHKSSDAAVEHDSATQAVLPSNYSPHKRRGCRELIAGALCVDCVRLEAFCGSFLAQIRKHRNSPNPEYSSGAAAMPVVWVLASQGPLCRWNRTSAPALSEKRATERRIPHLPLGHTASNQHNPGGPPQPKRRQLVANGGAAPQTRVGDV